jgi:hypothetical protein
VANEISVSITLGVTKGFLSIAKDVSVKADMAGTHHSAGAQTIGTSDEQIVFGSDVATAGFCWFRNLDATNYVDVGVHDGGGTFIAFGRLMPGQAALMPLATLSVYAKANTAAVVLEFELIEA